ncbi:hypothetical protein BD560DRAFT_381043 [Blakeslea trispora]|nr:hypothetical protein BD560DRAFT_381043 [Blakeslea trispora]
MLICSGFSLHFFSIDHVIKETDMRTCTTSLQANLDISCFLILSIQKKCTRKFIWNN